MVKKELVINLDNGLIGTFVRWEALTSEDGFVYLHYVPLDKIFPKKIKFPKPISKSCIHAIDPVTDSPGVMDRLIVIYEGGEGSLLNNILVDEFKEENEKLKDELKSLRQINASLKQQVEDMSSGIKKSIATSKSLSRSQERNDPFSPFGSGAISRQDSYDDEDYSFND